MNPTSSLFASRSKSLAFWIGSTMVTAGVIVHLPMFWMGRAIHFQLAGMPMSTGMLLGMALIVNFGVLLWLPGSLMATGRSMGLASTLIARSALIAVPTIALITYLYTVWSSKRVLVAAIGVTTLGLFATLLGNVRPVSVISNPLVSVSLLVVGTSAVISILLPYTSESFPVRLRGRATGWVAGCSKIGGVMAQGLALMALVPAFSLAAGAIALPMLASLLLVAIFGHETRGRDLRELEVLSGTRPEAASQD